MNRTYARIALVLAIALSLTALAQTGRAASSPASATPAVVSTKVGIIDLNRAIIGTNEGQRDFEELNKRFDPKRAEIKTKSDEVDGLKKQLQLQGDKMADEQRANLARQIDQKETALKRLYEDTQKDFQMQTNDVLNRVGQKFVKTLDKFARDNGYAVILDYGSENTPVRWAGPGVDISQSVVDAYNVDSGVPPPATPAAARPAPKPPTTTTTTPAKPR